MVELCSSNLLGGLWQLRNLGGLPRSFLVRIDSTHHLLFKELFFAAKAVLSGLFVLKDFLLLFLFFVLLLSVDVLPIFIHEVFLAAAPLIHLH